MLYVVLPFLVCVFHSSNATKAFMHAVFLDPLLQRRFLSFSSSAHSSHWGMHNTDGPMCLLEAEPCVLCMVVASVCLSQRQCSNSSRACCFFLIYCLTFEYE